MDTKLNTSFVNELGHIQMFLDDLIMERLVVLALNYICLDVHVIFHPAHDDRSEPL